jgi:hypothetical protein
VRAVYINLDAAAERRELLEASFRAANRGHDVLERFPALGPADVAEIAGSQIPAHKACFASHRAVLARYDDPAEDLLVLEDDAVLGPHTFRVLEALSAVSDWDVIFANVGAGSLEMMMELMRTRQAMKTQDMVAFVDLAAHPFFGTVGYLVRGRAKAKVLAALSPPQIDNQVDIHFRKVVEQGTLTAAVCCPFMVSISPAADESQINSGGVLADVANLFRRLMYVGVELDEVAGPLAALSEAYADDWSRAAGQVFAIMASDKLPAKI